MSLADQAALLAEIQGVLWGIETARRLAVASFMLFVYEHVLTIDKEIKYFWFKKEWSVSRTLYLSNRYLPYATLTCRRGIQTVLWLSTVNMAIIQAVLVFRIWHLFPRSPCARTLCISICSICSIATVITTGFVSANLQPPVEIPGLVVMGCTVPPPSAMWHVFVPPFVLHTALFLFPVVRAFRTPQMDKAPLMKRLLLDGGVFYVVVFISVGFSGIGAILTQYPSINIPAIYSNFMVAVTSVSISRVMLSIRSLAASLSSDPEWVLNHAELMRLHWKRGAYAGEIVVDVDPGDGAELEMALEAEARRRQATTRVAMASRMARRPGYEPEASAWF
ncbi:hypothetical protein PLICRDRAFT_49194 [Plicaturopsis crispa FD-325 SS-3]|nr:hypothetical protein PLICRDRAFT_49194 [Plicaturopsis crispa FD-325 SS-3]